jgi:hypothetical protein
MVLDGMFMKCTDEVYDLLKGDLDDNIFKHMEKTLKAK